MTTGLSSSGARIRGDDYQHLFTWLLVLEAADSGTDSMGIEDPKAGKADDVTVYMEDGRWRCYQAKYAVYCRTAGLGWLTCSKSGRPSIIQQFYRLWAEEHRRKPEITLVTNRLPADGDHLMGMIDSRDCTVARRLEHAEPGSRGDRTCSDLAEHLGTTKEETVAFFHDVRFELGMTEENLTKLVKNTMRTGGLCHDDEAVARGIGIVHGWVTAGKRKISKAELRAAVKQLKMADGSPTASVLIQMIDRDPAPEGATIALDWVDLFPGIEPRARHLPSDSALWNGLFRPEFRRAAQKLRSLNCTRVLVKGHMRLPTWFAVGAEFAKTADFEVLSLKGPEEWSSAGEVSGVATECDVAALGSGKDLVVGLALSDDLSPDVLSYVRGQRIDAGKYACLRPSGGPSDQAVGDAAEARGWARGVRDSVRRLASTYRPDQIHLFLSCPRGVALLLGHRWNRIPRTQLYEDLRSEGYRPSYLIPA